MQLVGQRQVLFNVFRWSLRQNFAYPAIDEKVRLVGVPQQVEARVKAGVGNSAKIDVACNVLQARKIKRIIVHTVTIMAHQCSVVALRMIVLTLSETIINQQNHPPFEKISKGVHQMPRR